MRYTHDCTRCVYLESQIFHDGRRMDWYRCPAFPAGHGSSLQDLGTILARFSGKDSDYWSMPIAMVLAAERITPMIARARTILDKPEVT